MQNDLEPGRPQQSAGLMRLGDRVAALVQFQDAVIQALDAHLDLGHAQGAEPGQLVRADLVGAGLNREPHIAVQSSFVEELGLHQPLRFLPPIFQRKTCRSTGSIHCLETTAHEPGLIIPAVGRKCSTQDEQFHLVGRMTNRSQGFQA